MRRNLFTIASTLSLLLCAALAALWVRSFWVADGIRFQRAHFWSSDGNGSKGGFQYVRIADDSICTSRGFARLYIRRSKGDLALRSDYLEWFRRNYPEGSFVLWERDPPWWNYFHLEAYAIAPVILVDRFGFFCGWADVQFPGEHVPFFAAREVTVPLWVFVVAALLLPSARALRWLRARRVNGTGECPRCAYNLTGNISGICPECGTAIRQPVRAE